MDSIDMILGYNTNGFAFHDPLQAIDVLGEIGYRSLAITVDHQWLNPYAADWRDQLSRVAEQLDRWSMGSAIETGARFLLDPRYKHQPTLVSPDIEDRRRREDFLFRCIDLAVELNSSCVSLWSGQLLDGCDAQAALDRLADSLQRVLDYATQRQVVLGFEPEPGMFIDSMAAYERLCRWIPADDLRLTLDVGHLYCQGEVPIADYIHRYRRAIVNVHIEDMRAGRHEHLAFGHGEISFPPVLEAFQQIDYAGPVHVELSRHSHDAVRTARDAFEFLQPIMAAK